MVAPAGIVVNLLLMGFLPEDTWLRLVIWLGIGMCIYFAYGYRKSVMRHVEAGDPTPGVPPGAFKAGDPSRETGIKE